MEVYGLFADTVLWLKPYGFRKNTVLFNWKYTVIPREVSDETDEIDGPLRSPVWPVRSWIPIQIYESYFDNVREPVL